MTTPLSNALPATAAKLLQSAAQTPNTVADPLRRQKAIEHATQHIQSQYPHLFRIQGAAS